MRQPDLATLCNDYVRARRRLLLLDYDGTLVPFAPTPEQAVPTPRVLKLLTALSQLPATTTILVSGRAKTSLDAWFSGIGITLAAEHGVYTKENGEWRPLADIDTKWQPDVLALLQPAAREIPGMLVEHKQTSLALHYRSADHRAGRRITEQAMRQLQDIIDRHNLLITHNDFTLEIRTKQATKGTLAIKAMAQADYDFILAAGDSLTDEDMFAVLPPTTYAIKVGRGATKARFRVASPSACLRVLETLAGSLPSDHPSHHT